MNEKKSIVFECLKKDSFFSMEFHTEQKIEKIKKTQKGKVDKCGKKCLCIFFDDINVYQGFPPAKICIAECFFMFCMIFIGIT